MAWYTPAVNAGNRASRLFGTYATSGKQYAVNFFGWCASAAKKVFQRQSAPVQPAPVPAVVVPQQSPVPRLRAVHGAQQAPAPSTIKIEGTPEQLRDFINSLTAAGGAGAGQAPPGGGGATAPAPPTGGQQQQPAEGWAAVFATLLNWVLGLLGWLGRHYVFTAALIAFLLVWFWLVPWVKGIFTLGPPGPIGGPPGASTPGATPPPVQPPSAGGALAPPAPIEPPKADGGLKPPASIGGGSEGGLKPPAPVDASAKGGELKPPAPLPEGGKPPPSPPAGQARATERVLPDGTIERVFPDGTIERHKKPTR